MERECLLSILVALLGGTMIVACGWATDLAAVGSGLDCRGVAIRMGMG